MCIRDRCYGIWWRGCVTSRVCTRLVPSL
ncbi:Pyruvate formate-lyase 1-activating enzyme, partial [Haemophilus influenzae]